MSTVRDELRAPQEYVDSRRCDHHHPFANVVDLLYSERCAPWAVALAVDDSQSVLDNLAGAFNKTSVTQAKAPMNPVALSDRWCSRHERWENFLLKEVARSLYIGRVGPIVIR